MGADYPLDANAQNSVFINESGVHSLILRCEKPEAKPSISGSHPKCYTCSLSSSE